MLTLAGVTFSDFLIKNLKVPGRKIGLSKAKQDRGQSYERPLKREPSAFTIHSNKGNATGLYRL